MAEKWHRWEEAEDAVLLEHYAEHGAKWDGWADLLPGRTRDAIMARAGKLGVRKSRNRRPVVHGKVSVPAFEPNEAHLAAVLLPLYRQWVADGRPMRDERPAMAT